MEHKVDQIEGVGFIPNIYHYFWLKDPVLDVVPIINIPDTVLFKANQPYAWYFEMNNTTKRKMKENISLENIEKSFLRKCEKQEIIAMWVTKKVQTDDRKDDFIIEYLNVQEFKQFCNKVYPIVRDGCLQRFIQPKGLKNYVIKAHWSPKMCFLERIQNDELFADKKKDLYKRVITFENDKCITNSVPLKGQILPVIIEKIIYNLVTHIQNVSEMKINRLVMNFKIDNNKRLWFLFCSLLNLDKPDQKIVKLNTQASYSLPHFNDNKNQQNLQNNIKKGNFCLGECGQQIMAEQLYKIQFSVIIQSWEYKNLYQQKKKNQLQQSEENQIENVEQLENQKVGQKIIPTPIQKMMPKLKVKEYIQQKNDPQFRDKQTMVCESCLIKILRYIENSEKILSTHKQPSIITKHLDPSKTKQRFIKTQEEIQTIQSQQIFKKDFAKTSTNRFSQLETCKTENVFKKSIFAENLMPIKDLSTLATMEFNSNSKVTKMEKIDTILQNHPKRNFLDYQLKKGRTLSIENFLTK